MMTEAWLHFIAKTIEIRTRKAHKVNAGVSGLSWERSTDGRGDDAVQKINSVTPRPVVDPGLARRGYTNHQGVRGGALTIILDNFFPKLYEYESNWIPTGRVPNALLLWIRQCKSNQ